MAIRNVWTRKLQGLKYLKVYKAGVDNHVGCIPEDAHSRVRNNDAIIPEQYPADDWDGLRSSVSKRKRSGAGGTGQDRAVQHSTNGI